LLNSFRETNKEEFVTATFVSRENDGSQQVDVHIDSHLLASVVGV
jgi:hypothetical protein